MVFKIIFQNVIMAWISQKTVGCIKKQNVDITVLFVCGTASPAQLRHACHVKNLFALLAGSDQSIIDDFGFSRFFLCYSQTISPVILIYTYRVHRGSVMIGRAFKVVRLLVGINIPGFPGQNIVNKIELIPVALGGH